MSYQEETRRLFQQAEANKQITSWAMFHGVRKAFVDSYSACALETPFLARLVAAYDGNELTQSYLIGVHNELKSLVKAKVLRSRRAQGKTFFEVNY